VYINGGAPVINGGLQALDKCLQINPEYDDAMVYENLLIRERVDLMDTRDQYEREIKTADDWVDKALATKKIKVVITDAEYPSLDIERKVLSKYNVDLLKFQCKPRKNSSVSAKMQMRY
jgi:hypothetical protein